MAPVAQLEYNSAIVANGAEITLPENSFKEAQYLFKLKNTGDYKLDVRNVIVENNSELSVKPSNTFTTINPEASSNIDLSFIPKTIGDKKYKITVNSDGYQSEKIEFYVNIKVVAAKLSLLDEDGNEYSHYDKFEFIYNGKGESVSKRLFIKNIGNIPLSISNIKEEFDYFDNFNIDIENKIDLAPSETKAIEISYSPDTEFRKKEHTTSLAISSNDLNYKDILFRIVAKNQYADIAMKSNEFDFEHNYTYDFYNTSVNKPKEAEFEIFNHGSIDLLMSDIKIIENESGYYKISKMPSKLTLKPGEKDIIKLMYAPQKIDGDNKVKLSITTNDYKCKEFNLNIQGYAQKPTLSLMQQNEAFGIANNELSNYGVMSASDIREQDYTFKNMGSDVLKVTDLQIIAPDGGKAIVSREINETIKYLDKNTFTIKYNCTKPGENIFTIKFSTNDYENNKFEFKVKFDARIPIFEIHTDKLLEDNELIDFIDNKSRKFTVKNNGTAALELKKLYFEGENKDDFELNIDKQYIETGEELSFIVKCISNTEGQKNAVLRIETNDINKPVIKLNINAKVDKLTSIKHNENLKIKLYPNPSVDYLYIEHDFTKPVIVTIYNMSGKMVFKSRYSETKIMLNHQLLSGTYMLILSDKKISIRRKILVQ